MAEYEKDAFKFCMVCGSEFETVSIIQKNCINCGYTYYIAAKPGASALITNPENELLLIKRGRDPKKGTWDIPAGFSDDLESLEDTLRREMKEEVNLDVKDFKYFMSDVGDYEYKGIIKRTLDACFIIKLSEDEVKTIKPGDDAAEIKWVALDEIDMSSIGFEEVKSRIEAFKKYLNNH